MAGTIMMCVVCFGCAVLFFSIGVYAKKLQKPMHFWSGVEVDAAKITDIAQYNRENGVMWQIYSLWYFAAGIAELYSPILAVLFLVLGCTAGIAVLVASYLRIFKKYSVK